MMVSRIVPWSLVRTFPYGSAASTCEASLMASAAMTEAGVE